MIVATVKNAAADTRERAIMKQKSALPKKQRKIVKEFLKLYNKGKLPCLQVLSSRSLTGVKFVWESDHSRWGVVPAPDCERCGQPWPKCCQENDQATHHVQQVVVFQNSQGDSITSTVTVPLAVYSLGEWFAKPTQPYFDEEAPPSSPAPRSNPLRPVKMFDYFQWEQVALPGSSKFPDGVTVWALIPYGKMTDRTYHEAQDGTEEGVINNRNMIEAPLGFQIEGEILPNTIYRPCTEIGSSDPVLAQNVFEWWQRNKGTLNAGEPLPKDPLSLSGDEDGGDETIISNSSPSRDNTDVSINPLPPFTDLA